MQGRHDIIVTLANLSMDAMTEEEIIRLCPADYGSEVTDDHLNYIWDVIYTEYDEMGDDELHQLVQRIEDERRRGIMSRWMEGESDEEPITIPNPGRTLH